MEKILEKLRSNSLLLKILSVMLLSVICVATLTLSISIRAFVVNIRLGILYASIMARTK